MCSQNRSAGSRSIHPPSQNIISSVQDAELSEEVITDSLTLLSWYIHRLWKSLVRHILPATKLIAETYPHILPKLPETLHYIHDENWFPENFVNIPEIPSETIQKLSINRQYIQIKKYNAKTSPFTFTNNSEKVNTSLETSPLENMETIVHSQQTDTHINETTETDFNSTLLDDGTLFSSHAVNTLIDLESNDHQTINNNNITQTTIDNTGNNHNYQNRQPVNSTELLQNSDPLNTALLQLPNINTPLPLLNRQNFVHFNTEPTILNNSYPYPLLIRTFKLLHNKSLIS